MKKRRKPIRLRPDEDQLISKLYEQWRIPRGQYKRHTDYLDEFTKLWNKLSGRTDSSTDVLHYMDTQQKLTSSRPVPWPTFNGAHKRLEPVAEVLSKEHMDVLRSLYQQIVLPKKVGTEGLIYHKEIIDELSRAFFTATKLSVPGMMLASKIEAERKGGSWFTLRDSDKSDRGFGDLDDIASA